MRLTAHLNLPAPGRSQSVYVGLDNALARSCVFAKQSLGTILCGRSLLPLAGHILPAPLIPKLRGNFAEFLFRKSLEPLRLLASPTCVGLRYGQLQSWSAKLFLAACVGHPLRSLRPFGIGSRLSQRICLPGNAYHLAAENPPPAGNLASASLLGLVTAYSWYGNVDPFPIVYASRPRLRDRLTLS